MSTSAPARPGAAPEPVRARAHAHLGPDRILAVGLAGALALLAFLTTGGTSLGPNTWAEIALVALGAAAAGIVLVRPPGRARHGLGMCAAFCALVVLTALSIAWSIVPDQSWLEAGRTVAYLGAFATAVVGARMAPARWRGVLGAIALLTTGLSAWALATKVFPGALDPVEPFGRLRLPFDYWNATGVTAAMGLPTLLWLAARPDTSRALRSVCVPGLAVLLTALSLTSSRSALVATLCGLGAWFWLVPLRLRGAGIIAAGVLAATPPVAWSLAHDALTHDRVPLGSRVGAGQRFGLVLVLALLLAGAAAWRLGPAADRLRPPPATRRRIGAALLAALALVPIGGLIAAAASSRGIDGELSHVWAALTNPNGGTGNAPGRLVALGNSRALYWREGISVGSHHLLAGAGAGAFAVVRTRYTLNRGIVAHAHSYPIETFAGLGVLGLLVSLGLLVTWGRAAARTFGHGADRPRLEPGERAGLLTLVAVVVTFGVHSTIDWTWQIPGVAVPALICAAWVAARAPGAPGRAGEVGRPRSRPLAAPAIAGIVVAALLTAWAIWQPLRAADAIGRAQDALVAGRSAAALSEAHRAASEDPLSPKPLWTEAEVYSAAGELRAARRALVDAVSLEPQNPASWRELGRFDQTHGRNAQLAVDLAHIRRLDRADPALVATYVRGGA